MPRRPILSQAEREELLSIPESLPELARLCAFSESDLSIIRQRRGVENRLGFAVLLCYMRHPGILLGPAEAPSPSLLGFVASQVNIPAEAWAEYGRQREQTRREHIIELQSTFKFKSFTMDYYHPAVMDLEELAVRTDKGVEIAAEFVRLMRSKSILLPSLDVVERICAEASTLAARRIHKTLAGPLSDSHRAGLDGLLALRENGTTSVISWLRQSPRAPNARHLLEHIERLNLIRNLALPDGLDRQVHQNRLLKLAREGGRMTSQHLQDLEPMRRYATLAAVAVEAGATLTDEIIDMNDRIIGALFSRAKKKHERQFQESGKAINEKVRLYFRVGQALLEAKLRGDDPFAAIETILPWDDFAQSVTDAEKLARTEDFDFLNKIGDGYSQIRRYAPEFLASLQLKAAPAAKEVLEAVELLKSLNGGHWRKRII